MDRPYTVALRDGKALPTAERIQAECRFITALEAALGTPDAILATYTAWTQANESQGEIGPQIASMAARWRTAYRRACEAGMRGVYGITDVTFDFMQGPSA